MLRRSARSTSPVSRRSWSSTFSAPTRRRRRSPTRPIRARRSTRCAPARPPRLEPGAAATAGEVLVGAGNIATCGGVDDEATANLLDAIPGTVVTLGDNAFPHGTLADYTNCYDPSWGRHKSRTYGVLGNHEYDTGNANGAFDYFGARAGPRDLGYYSFDL